MKNEWIFYWESDNFFFLFEISLNIQVLQLFKDNKVKSCWRMKNINHLDLHWRRKGETSVTPLEVKVNCIISYSLASLIQIICFIWINQTIFCLTRINHTFFYFQSLHEIFKISKDLCRHLLWLRVRIFPVFYLKLQGKGDSYFDKNKSFSD